MDAIVSVTQDWAIGANNGLLIENREDLRRFARLTRGGTVVMGRRTLESLPGGKGLKDRRNIVVTRGEFTSDDVVVVHSPDAAFVLTDRCPVGKTWLIGGASLYEAMLPFCERVFVTMHHTVVPADTWFANLDESDEWKLEAKEPGGTTPDGIVFDYLTYVRTTPVDTRRIMYPGEPPFSV